MHKLGELMNPKNIGFVSTRFAGTDGVSIEASKWAQVLEKMLAVVFGSPENWIGTRPKAYLSPKLFSNTYKING